MSPTHHPSDALLMAYAAGTVSEAESLALGTHLTFCPSCRASMMAAEAIGGALLDGIEASPMEPGALQSVLTRLDESVATPAPRVDRAMGLPSALAGYAADALAQSRWQFIAPGIRQLRLHTSGAMTARLMKLKPGTRLPEHGHRGTELTLLLAGSYTDELGQFKRGDLAELDETIHHRPMVDQGEECIALIVTEGSLNFRGWMARLAQPFIGI